VTNSERPGWDAAQTGTKDAAAEPMQGLEEMYPDVHKSVEEVRSEWAAEAKKMWLWLAGVAVLGLAGLVVQVFWVLGLVAAGFAAYAWDVQNERRSTYKRMLRENAIEQSIREHEAKAAAAGRDEITR
jgi:hypothetical protein